jgi:hypothetical protein
MKLMFSSTYRGDSITVGYSAYPFIRVCQDYSKLQVSKSRNKSRASTRLSDENSSPCSKPLVMSHDRGGATQLDKLCAEQSDRKT